MRFLLDTNVLADFYLQRERFSESVNGLVASAICGDVELWASAKSYTDIFYVGRKHFAPEVLQNAFLASFSFIHICTIGKDDLENAARQCWNDFEDCLVCVAAVKADADFIVTRDAKGFAASTMETATPQEALDLLAERGEGGTGAGVHLGPSGKEGGTYPSPSGTKDAARSGQPRLARPADFREKER